MRQAILKEIKVKRIADEDPDLSYLEQYENPKDEEEEKYYQQDQERLSKYGYEWEMVGIKAVAIVYIPFEVFTGKGKEINYKIQEIDSGGLWGIETDSDEEYIQEIEQQQIEELKDYLQVFNVNTNDFNWEENKSNYVFFKNRKN